MDCGSGSSAPAPWGRSTRTPSARSRLWRSPASCRALRPGRRRPRGALWQGGDQAYGGVVVDVMIHDFDFLNWLFGDPRSVSAVGHRTGPDRIDHVIATVRYDGAEVVAEGSMLPPTSFPFNHSLRVICERGLLDYDFSAGGNLPAEGQSKNALTVYPPDGASYQAAMDPRSAYLIQARYFVDCLRRGTPPEIGTGEQARAA